jgi:Tol biopolymer transport system component
MCWGDPFGDLPNVVAGMESDVVQITTGQNHLCAVTSAGGVKCWGANGYGQLGDGTTTDRSTAVDVVGLQSGITSVEAGIYHTCAVTAAGGVKCWGNNDWNELGAASSASYIATPVDVAGLSSGVVDISAGEELAPASTPISATCVVMVDTSMKCWGGLWTVPTSVVDSEGDPLLGFAQVGVGWLSICAVKTTGAGVCWDGSQPVEVISSGVADVSAGLSHDCFALVNGGAKCQGSNTYGQLGDGTTVNHATPVDVVGLKAPLPEGLTSMISKCICGGHANRFGDGPAISTDGSTLGFYSEASNIILDDTNGAADVFLRDRTTGALERVSIDSAGNEGNAHSPAYWLGAAGPSFSSDGQFVAFLSYASNLVPGDTNAYCDGYSGSYSNCPDVFVRDRSTGETTIVSVDSAGNHANGPSASPAISADGRYVAFASSASNLVQGDTNTTCELSPYDQNVNCQDVFVHDRSTGTTERVSLDSSGAQLNNHSSLPAISADGRFVAFSSNASNVVPGDINECAFTSGVGACSDVFVHDRQTGVTELVSTSIASGTGDGGSLLPSMSADGRLIAFSSSATDLVEGDSNAFCFHDSDFIPDNCADIFVRDTLTGRIALVSTNSDGEQGDRGSCCAHISAGGRYVAFRSSARNLVAGDTNNRSDLFVRDLLNGATTRVSVDSLGAEANGDSTSARLSGDGRFVVFHSFASNLVPAGGTGVFLRDRDDEDGVDWAGDNCPDVQNPGQDDNESDNIGDMCDPDDDNDGQSDDNEIACGFDPFDAGDTPSNYDDDASPDCLDVDDDNDACIDTREQGSLASQGGLRDQFNVWDFYDTPTPQAYVRDHAVTIADIAAIIARFGASGDAGIDPLSPPTAPPAYHTAYDRSFAGPEPWKTGPPNGSVSIEDITLAVGQFGHSCL